MHQCLRFVLFGVTLYMFRTVFSVHHQEFKTVRTATGICPTDTAECLLAGTRWNCSSISSSISFPLASSQQSAVSVGHMLAAVRTVLNS